MRASISSMGARVNRPAGGACHLGWSHFPQRERGIERRLDIRLPI